MTVSRMVTFETVLDVVPALSVAVALIYYALNLRNANKTQMMQLETRQIELFMRIYDKFNDNINAGVFTEVLTYEWEGNEDFWRKYSLEANPDAYRKWNYLAGFLDGVGVLVKRGFIDPVLVDDLMSASILTFWEKYGSAIIDGRERLNMPMMWEWTEYLYHEIKKIAEQEHGELKNLTP